MGGRFFVHYGLLVGTVYSSFHGENGTARKDLWLRREEVDSSMHQKIINPKGFSKELVAKTI